MKRLVFPLGLALLCAPLAVAQIDRPMSEPPVELTGRVVDPQLRPIEGAAVVALPSQNAFVLSLEWTVDELLEQPTVRTEKDGAFRLRTQPGSMLLVAAPGRMALMIRSLSLLQTSRGNVHLGAVVLPEGVVHVGTVRDPEGRPIAGAHLRVVLRIGLGWNLGGVSHSAWAATRSDERGVFRLVCAPQSGFCLAVTAAGYADATLEPIGAGTPLNVELTPTGFLSGQVVDAAGEPIAGLELRADYEAAVQELLSSFRTDADGRFRVTRQGHGRARIFGVDPATGSRIASPVLEDPWGEVVMTAPGGPQVSPPQIHVRVLDAASGEPITGARVVARACQRSAEHPLPPGLPMADGPWSHHDCPTTDADGRVALSALAIKSLRAELRVRAAGHAPWIGDVDREHFATGIEVRLEPEAAASGRVVASDGQPVVGADVFWGWRGDGVPTVAHAVGRPPHAVRTDEEGRYELRGLPRAGVEILATAAGFQSPPTVVLDTTTEQDVTADFVLEPGREIVLRLPESASGAGIVAGFEFTGSIQRMLIPGRQTLHMRDATIGSTFEDGAVRWVVEGRLNLEPFLERMARDTTIPQVLRFPLPRLEPGGDVEVVLTSGQLATSRVVGQLRTNHARFEQLLVLLEAVGADPRATPRYFAPLDAGGRFAIEVLPGDFRIEFVDLVTGARVYRDEEVATALAGDVLELDFELDLKRVLVELLPRAEAGAESFAGVLDFRFWTPSFETRDTGGSNQFPTWRARRSFELFLPQGRLGVRVREGARDLNAAGGFRPPFAAEAEFKITREPVQRFELSLPRPMPTAEIDR